MSALSAQFAIPILSKFGADSNIFVNCYYQETQNEFDINANISDT